MKEEKALLKSVSRSFYLSMRFLPRLMRDGVSCAYLLARATDSVADTSTLPVERRHATLEQMRGLINGLPPAADSACLTELRRDYAESVGHQGEKELLSCFGECLGLMSKLPAEEIALVRVVLNTIIDGQIWDLTYFESNRQVGDEEELDLYTYRVAGCVGEFWSDMGFLCYGDRFAKRSLEEMKKLGRLYGEGLQLVNILRDRAEDERNGRCYIPDSLPIGHWFDKAQFKLEQGIAYAKSLKGIKLRFTSILPALLGVKTLGLIKQSGSERAKISRKAVRASMYKALMIAIFG